MLDGLRDYNCSMELFNKNIQDKVQIKLLPLLTEFEDFTRELEKNNKQKIIWISEEENIKNRLNNSIDLLWFSYVSKFYYLNSSLIKAINENNFLLYGLIGRAIIENVGVLKYYQEEKIIPKIQKAIKEGNISTHEIKEILAEIEKHLKGRRFDWGAFFKGDLEKIDQEVSKEVEQINVKTCFDHWYKKDKSIKSLYGLFCDLVHPNIGSNLLVMKEFNDGIGFGGDEGKYFGFELFDRTFAGLVIISRIGKTLSESLILLKFEN